MIRYGQSGSGKTWTMEGPTHSGDKAGQIPRVVNQLFEELNFGSMESVVTVSYVEVGLQCVGFDSTKKVVGPSFVSTFWYCWSFLTYFGCCL